jgi:hypothetical protein
VWQGEMGLEIMTPQDFEVAFPKVMNWIQRTLGAYERVARPVASKNFSRLLLYFSQAQVAAAKYVLVDRIPVPPLSSMGLPGSTNLSAATMMALLISIRIF